MPHRPSAPPGIRFFARLDRFHCECPACGQLIVAHKDARAPEPTRKSRTAAFKRSRYTQYNPITSILTCPACRLSFGVGLLLWPLARGRRRARIPADHQPTRRQLRQLAQYSYGIWGEEVKQQGDELNIAIDQECTCPQLEGGWRESCPVHGWEAFKALREGEVDTPPPPVEYEPGEEPED